MDISEDRNYEATGLWKQGLNSDPNQSLQLFQGPISGLSKLGNSIYFLGQYFSNEGLGLYKLNDAGTTPILVKEGVYSQENETVASGNIFYFISGDDTYGTELWRSDGTTGGTFLLKDIFPGGGSSYPQHLVNINGTLYFTATDDSETKLWKTNGTTAATVAFNFTPIVVKPDLTAAPGKQWDKTFGGIGQGLGDTREDARITIHTSDGGYLVCGTSASKVGADKTAASKGDYDYWIVKISANGSKLWDKTFGGTDADILTSAIGTTDGGFLLVGYSRSGISGDKTQATQDFFYNYWVIKISANGSKLWDKTFAGNWIDMATTVIATADGGFLIGGYSDSGAVYDKTEYNRGFSDYWVIKISANGSKLWDKTFGAQGRITLPR
ncbi:hypothetical protein GXP67_31625 [Rhodocytophaga rosea]|uniref:Hyalin n=1 Tax=Rhodocytophaga rosea TaxID=2704465 RepID=A0A6C0GS35_9BACT|nr:ELWxxDGT repeat protein [Rhodocytophaga rosea]QHT70876.1 hypothetical protein GXP67_31625 [Rhodocytophaga rosea]